jgi:hypothetical protein
VDEIHGRQPDLRSTVARRAENKCEYCLIHSDDAGFPHHVDHILSRKHGGESELDNLALACMLCNRYKGSDIASVTTSGTIVAFYNPRKDYSRDHFRIAGAIIQPLTPAGEATARILKFNVPERILERRLLQAMGRYPA